MEEEFDVLEEVESPRSCGAFVHLLLVLGLVGVDPLQDAEAPGGGDKSETRGAIAPNGVATPRTPKTTAP